MADADDELGWVGSLSRVTGKSMQMDDLLPDWLEHGVESSLRDSEYDSVPVVVAPSALPAVVLTETRPSSRTEGTDLDSFYADPEELSEEESEEEEDDDDDDESEDEEDADESGQR